MSHATVNVDPTMEQKNPTQLATQRTAAAHSFLSRMTIKRAAVTALAFVLSCMQAAVVPATLALIVSDDDFTRWYKFLGAHSGPGLLLHTWTMLGAGCVLVRCL